MAKRQNIFEVKSDAVQGEGSFVKLRSVSYGMGMEAREKMTKDHSVADEKGFVASLLRENVVIWDWVDDNDQPLPIPADGLDIEKLTATEVEFLISAITGQTSAETKN